MTMPNPRPGLLSAERRDDDSETSLRPLSLADFTGQAAARANLQVFINAAKSRGDALDHVLFVLGIFFLTPRWRQASARRRWRRSWRASSASASVRPPGR